MKDARKPFLYFCFVVTFLLWSIATACFVHILSKGKANNVDIVLMISLVVSLTFGTFNLVWRRQYLTESAMMYKHVNKQTAHVIVSLNELKEVVINVNTKHERS